MRASRRNVICELAAALVGAFLMPVAAMASPEIEIVPLAVWQGKETRPWSIALLQDIRKAFPGAKIAHAVDAAPMARGGASEFLFRSQFAGVIHQGDDVLLHVAPWKSLVVKSGVSFKYEPTVFGAAISPEDCAKDCGLELSFSGFSASEAQSMISSSMKMLSQSGFGETTAIYFDEGVVASEYRSAARRSGMAEDWSGIELTQLKGVLGRFPVYEWNVKNTGSFPVKNVGETMSDGLKLDHVRFSLHAEVGDMDQAVGIIKSALDAARGESRRVRIPIVFNVEDLIHTQSFVSESLTRVTAMAAEAGVPVRDLSALNTSWNVEKIRAVAAPMPLVAIDAQPVDEPQFVPDVDVTQDDSVAH